MWSVLHSAQKGPHVHARLNHVTRRHRNYVEKEQHNHSAIEVLTFSEHTLPGLRFLAKRIFVQSLAFSLATATPQSCPQRIIGTRSGRQNLHNRGLGDGSQTARVTGLRVLTIVIASSVKFRRLAIKSQVMQQTATDLWALSAIKICSHEMVMVVIKINPSVIDTAAR